MYMLLEIFFFLCHFRFIYRVLRETDPEKIQKRKQKSFKQKHMTIFGQI